MAWKSIHRPVQSRLWTVTACEGLSTKYLNVTYYLVIFFFVQLLLSPWNEKRLCRNAYKSYMFNHLVLLKSRGPGLIQGLKREICREKALLSSRCVHQTAWSSLSFRISICFQRTLNLCSFFYFLRRNFSWFSVMCSSVQGSLVLADLFVMPLTVGLE